MRVNAKKVFDDNVWFDSKTEHKHYCELKMLLRNRDITRLQVHPKFTFIVQGVVVGTYKPDFAYHDREDRLHVEDVKGFKASKKTGKLLPCVNREFGLKCKLMKALFAIEVEIV